MVISEKRTSVPRSVQKYQRSCLTLLIAGFFAELYIDIGISKLVFIVKEITAFVEVEEMKKVEEKKVRILQRPTEYGYLYVN